MGAAWELHVIQGINLDLSCCIQQSWQGKENIPSPCFGTSVLLLLHWMPVIFFHCLASVKEDFNLPHPCCVLKLLFWTLGLSVVCILLRPLVGRENCNLLYQSIWLNLLQGVVLPGVPYLPGKYILLYHASVNYHLLNLIRSGKLQ